MDTRIYPIPDHIDKGKEEHVYKNPNCEKIEQVNKSCGKPKFDVMKLAKLAIYGAVVVGLVGFTVAIVSILQVNRLNSEIAGDLAEMKAGVNEVIDTTQDQVASDLRDFQAKVNTSLQQLQLEVQDVGVGGAVYIRWGRTVCPENSTAVYAGIAAGDKFDRQGGSSTTICLPGEPIFENHYSGGHASLIYGTEYIGTDDQMSAIFGTDVNLDDVPCVVCEATGHRFKMLVPARNVCFGGWHLEYSGYLMTAIGDHRRANMYCVDHSPEVVNETSASNGGNYFYFVEAQGTIPDPPYTRGKELTCAICTK